MGNKAIKWVEEGGVVKSPNYVFPNSDWTTIPWHMRDSLWNYVMIGLPPGGFLEAVLENNLAEAAGRADHINSRSLKEWALFMHNDVPHSCWGSKEAVDKWLAMGGMASIMEAERSELA